MIRIITTVKCFLGLVIILSLLAISGTITYKRIELAELQSDSIPANGHARKIHKLPIAQYDWEINPENKYRRDYNIADIKENHEKVILKFDPKTPEKPINAVSPKSEDIVGVVISESVISEDVISEDVYENGVRILSEASMLRIEERFKIRRAKIVSNCEAQNRKAVSSYEEIQKKTFYYNHIFNDPVMQLSGCIPPKTGSTSWNHFWWGMSKFDGAGKGFFDSFQSQGNQYRSVWSSHLAKTPPKILFLQTRHPIKRLISGWNNILCEKNCRDAGRVTYAKGVLKRVDNILTKNLRKGPHLEPRKSREAIRMIDFEDWVDIIQENDMDKYGDFDIHFHSYERACYPCDYPYEYIVKLETFEEDYQYILRKMDLWDSMNDAHKQAGSVKENQSVGLNYTEILSNLPLEKRQKLYEMKKLELEMFGYEFDPVTFQMSSL